MKTRSLTTEEKARIVGMHEAGVKGVQIASQLNHPTTTIYTVIKNSRRRGTVESPKSPGAPKKLSERDVRILTRTLTQDRRQPLADIAASCALKVSGSTIRTALHEAGFYSRVAAKKPFLSDRHIAGRLAFAKAHRSWTVDDWKRVIWSDESTFEIGKNSRRLEKDRRTIQVGLSNPKFQVTTHFSNGLGSLHCLQEVTIGPYADRETHRC